MFIELELLPGLFRNGTLRQASGRYFEANFVRFFEKTLRPIKGFSKLFTNVLSGNARAAHSWLDNDEEAFAAFATHTKLYAYDGASLEDITPSGFVAGDAHASGWTLDNFGELLIACNDSTQKIYEWTPGSGVPASIITNSPDAKAAFVTEEKFIVGLGIDGDPRALGWCDQENRTVWTPMATNQAGDLPTNQAGILMCGTRLRGASLIFSTECLYVLRYLGLPDVYGLEQVASGCGIVGRHAFQPVDSMCFWMAQGGFYQYVGYAQQLPCEIGDDVFTNLNRSYAHKVWCDHRPEFCEVWWHYPRGSAMECSHYVIYNYREGHWNHGELARLAGFSAGTGFANPVKIDADGNVLSHEVGWDYTAAVELLDDDGSTYLLDDDGSTLLTDDNPGSDAYQPYAITGPLELGTGERRLQLNEIIPDESTQGDCEVKVYSREFPNATETLVGTFQASDRMGVFTTAREIRFEYRATAGSEDFRIGRNRADVQGRGRH